MKLFSSRTDDGFAALPPEKLRRIEIRAGLPLAWQFGQDR